MADIKLFVCCHQPVQVPRHPLLFPIQVGTALTSQKFSGFLHDDTGENISIKNRAYCELTAQYWVWKNIEADYYGFFHYRRYLYPEISTSQPYRIAGKPTLHLLDKLGYNNFSELIKNYDLILPIGENMHIPVREHYARAPYHHRKDLELIEQLVKQKYPEMSLALESYFSGTICYFGNIYIMRKEIFYDYCSWLFSLLEEFDHNADKKEYTSQEQRVDGYIAERLLGVYLRYKQDNLRVLELPRVHFEPRIMQRWKMQALNFVLPPGTCRRAVFKRVINGSL